MEEARDTSSMGFGKVKSKKEAILEAQRDQKKVHFATLMSRALERHAKRRRWSVCSDY